MKKLNQFLVLITAVSLLTFSACSSNEDGDLGNAPAGLLVAKVDGKSYTSFEQSSSATIASVGSTGKNLIIIASNSDGNAFSFTILGYDGEGKTYPLGGGANIFNSASYSETNVNLSNPLASTTKIWQAPYDDTKVGEVIITQETNTNIKGTFSFKSKNVAGDGSIKNITEGSFDLKKQSI